MRQDTRPALKTDLFDEAISEGVFEVMRERCSRVHGVDVAHETACEAQRRHPLLTAHVADVRDMPFQSDTFGHVVSLSTLDHFESIGDTQPWPRSDG